MILFTTVSYSVTWARLVPEILSHNWRLIWFPRLLRVVDSGGGCWGGLEIDYSNHKEGGVPLGRLFQLCSLLAQGFLSLVLQPVNKTECEPSARREWPIQMYQAGESQRNQPSWGKSRSLFSLSPESINAPNKPVQELWLSWVCNVNNMKVNSGGHSKIVWTRLIYWWLHNGRLSLVNWLSK